MNIFNAFETFKCVLNISKAFETFETYFEYFATRLKKKHVANIQNALIMFQTRC